MVAANPPYRDIAIKDRCQLNFQGLFWLHITEENHCRCFGAECGLDYLIKMTMAISAQQHRQLIHHLERGASLILMHFALSPGSTAQVVLRTGVWCPICEDLAATKRAVSRCLSQLPRRPPCCLKRLLELREPLREVAFLMKNTPNVHHIDGLDIEDEVGIAGKPPESKTRVMRLLIVNNLVWVG